MWRHDNWIVNRATCTIYASSRTIQYMTSQFGKMDAKNQYFGSVTMFFLQNSRQLARTVHVYLHYLGMLNMKSESRV